MSDVSVSSCLCRGDRRADHAICKIDLRADMHFIDRHRGTSQDTASCIIKAAVFSTRLWADGNKEFALGEREYTEVPSGWLIFKDMFALLLHSGSHIAACLPHYRTMRPSKTCTSSFVNLVHLDMTFPSLYKHDRFGAS